MPTFFAEHKDYLPEAVWSARCVMQELSAETSEVHMCCVQRMDALLDAMGWERYSMCVLCADMSEPVMLRAED